MTQSEIHYAQAFMAEVAPLGAGDVVVLAPDERHRA
jgi:hypothetical protein